MSLSRRDLLLGAAASALTACASSPPRNISNACDIFTQKRSWYRATRRAEKKWGVPIALQLAIIRQESSFDRDAKPGRKKFLFVFPGARKSSARGFPQAIEQTWEQYKKATRNRGANRRNFKDATDFVGWYCTESSKRLGIAKNNAYQQYLAYHEGWGGYSKGSFRGKTTLQASARRVSESAARYDAQLNRCEKKFRRGIPLIPGI